MIRGRRGEGMEEGGGGWERLYGNQDSTRIVQYADRTNKRDGRKPTGSDL
jgi:hypothetical protein